MKRFTIFILLNLVLGLPIADAYAPFPKSHSQLDNSKQAVWQIDNKRYKQNTSGTGFFIGTKLFVTNFHVIAQLLPQSFFIDEFRESIPLENQDTFYDIVLTQEGNDSVLKINKVLAVSAFHDLALLETEEDVTDYLSLRKSPPYSSENLFVIAYPRQIFTEIRKTGNIAYEDELRYDFPVNHSSFRGASGGPILDQQGQVVGVAFYGTQNMLGAIKINHLREFIAGNIGVKCSDPTSIKVCLKEEIQYLKELAQKGSVYAQDNLAQMYRGGRNIEQSSEQAFQLYKKAAEQGYVLSQYGLAFMYYFIYYYGIGIPKDLHNAFHWFEKAAEQAYAPAQHQLATMYEKGEGVEKDLEKAFHWLQQSVEQAYAPAQFQLATMYEKGEGVEQDPEKALYWLQQAVEQAYAPAQFQLATMYEKGEGVEQDPEKALYWLQQAVEQAYAPAQFQLATMYEKGEGVEQDPEKALHWLQKAARQYHTPAQFQLSTMYEKGEGVEKDLEKALYWLQKAAKQGYSPAQHKLARMFYSPEGIDENLIQFPGERDLAIKNTP